MIKSRLMLFFFFFSSRRRHTRCYRDWSSDVCSSDLLALRLTQLLDAIGFPLCLGNVMATNPVWRKRISEWRKQIAIWLRRRTETQLLLSDILVDFHHVWGDAALSQTLRRYIMQAIAESPTFVRDLFTIEADHGAALGWFGRLRSERDKQ